MQLYTELVSLSRWKLFTWKAPATSAESGRWIARERHPTALKWPARYAPSSSAAAGTISAAL